MSQPEYRWRQLTPKQREDLLAWRKTRGHPWHSPPHRPNFGHRRFHVTAACFEHQPYIGHIPERMDAFARDLLAVFAMHASQTFAWCVLPNHYHALVEAPDILGLLRELGRLHGRTSHAWNGEENSRGRKVFFRAEERGKGSRRMQSFPPCDLFARAATESPSRSSGLLKPTCNATATGSLVTAAGCRVGRHGCARGFPCARTG